MSSYRIYKPRKDQQGAPAGAASQLNTSIIKPKDGEFDERNVLVFWTITPQTKCAVNNDDTDSFDWQTKKNPEGKQITVKLGDADISEFLTVLRGIKRRVGGPNKKGLYHENAKGNSGIILEYDEQKDREKFDDRYLLSISSNVDGKFTKYSHSISLAEGEIIRVILEDVVRFKYGI